VPVCGFVSGARARAAHRRPKKAESGAFTHVDVDVDVDVIANVIVAALVNGNDAVGVIHTVDGG
jgi:hypothetical protein